MAKPPHRPTLLTPQLEAVLIAALAATPVKKYAAEHGGISDRTWHKWEAAGAVELEALAAKRGVEPEDLSLSNVTFDDSPTGHFLLSVRKSRSDYLIGRLGKIRQAGDGIEAKTIKEVTRKDPKTGKIVEIETTITTKTERQWTAEAWLVERQYPEFRTQRIEVTGKEGGPIETVTESPADRLARLTAEMAEREDRRDELIEQIAGDDPVGSVDGEPSA